MLWRLNCNAHIKCHTQSPWHIVGAHVNSLSKSYIRDLWEEDEMVPGFKGKGKEGKFPLHLIFSRKIPYIVKNQWFEYLNIFSLSSSKPFMSLHRRANAEPFVISWAFVHSFFIWSVSRSKHLWSPDSVSKSAQLLPDPSTQRWRVWPGSSSPVGGGSRKRKQSGQTWQGLAWGLSEFGAKDSSHHGEQETLSRERRVPSVEGRQGQGQVLGEAGSS